MKFILSCFSLLIILAMTAGVVGVQQFTAPGPLTEPATIVVERGQGVSTIAARLEEARVISNALLFKAAVRLSNNQSTLKAGEYEFPAHVSMSSVMRMMADGAVVQRRFTVPEGRTSWQVVEILKATEALSGTVDTIPAEGSLLPDTYSFVKDEARADKITQMQTAMKETLDSLWATHADNLPLLSPAEAVILASIVEKETGVAAERPRIAGVFINRLRRGIPLQSDPTVIYALTNGKLQDNGMGPLGRRLLREDLDFASPYNTYKNPGLPPGPIANPGKDALAAVLNPEVNDYIYFVADGTGGHVFARTLDEHNANVAKWRQIRKQQE